MAEIVRAGLNSVDDGPDRGGQVDRHDAADHVAPSRAAAGDARDHPADRQQLHQHDQGHLDGVGDRRAPELIHAANNISSRNLEIMETLFAAAAWYLVMVSVAASGSTTWSALRFGRA